MSDPLLMSKACDLARDAALDMPTMGFINKSKSRHHIVFKTAHGESTEANHDAKEKWLQNNIAKILAFEPRDVYNMDETGLYYRALPSGILCFKDDVVKGSKTIKDRITLALTVNMDGSHKSLLVVG